jgi:hypothetical protein
MCSTIRGVWAGIGANGSKNLGLATLSIISWSRIEFHYSNLRVCAYLCIPDSIPRLFSRWVASNSLGSLDTSVAHIPPAFSVTNKRTITKSSTLPRVMLITQQDAMKGVTNWCQTRRLHWICANRSKHIFHPPFVNWVRLKQLLLDNQSELDTCSYNFSHKWLIISLIKILTFPHESSCRFFR